MSGYSVGLHINYIRSKIIWIWRASVLLSNYARNVLECPPKPNHHTQSVWHKGSEVFRKTDFTKVFKPMTFRYKNESFMVVKYRLGHNPNTFDSPAWKRNKTGSCMWGPCRPVFNLHLFGDFSSPRASRAPTDRSRGHRRATLKASCCPECACLSGSLRGKKLEIGAGVRNLLKKQQLHPKLSLCLKINFLIFHKEENKTT